MAFTLYKITNKINGMVYIGQTTAGVASSRFKPGHRASPATEFKPTVSVRCVETRTTLKTIRDAAVFFGVRYEAIRRVIYGERPSIHGLHFEKVNP
jgi:hypothetical protein